ncbi:MAG: hypothetical protein M3082_05645, partial [Candidatus Dormibacteraeota bacterium]|nr:hypothetical protein [Candidatus Dormibacteraeota bacterium]
SSVRRIAFFAWAAILSAAFGIGFFGLTVLIIGWFEQSFGVSTPVSELSHGALAGIIITVGLLAQLRAPARRIAGVQQAVLGILTFLITALIGGRQEPLQESLLFLVAVAILVALHPARREFFKPGAGVSPALAAISLLGAIPATGYAVSMLVQARQFVGPPHHADRFAEMAAAAIAIVFVGLLAALKTHGWTIPARSAGVAAIVVGMASVVFPDAPGAVGHAWGAVAVGWGVLFLAAAEWEARQRTGAGS